MTQNMLKSRATLCDTKLQMVLAPLKAVHKLDITELLMTMQLLQLPYGHVSAGKKQQLFTLQHLSLFSQLGLLFSVFISLITSQQEGTNTGKHLNNQKSQNRKHKNPTVVILRLNLKTWLQQKVSEVSNELEKHNKCLKLTLYQDWALLLYSNFSHTSRLAHTLCTQQQWALQYCNYASMQHKDKVIGTSIFSHHCSSNNNNSDM